METALISDNKVKMGKKYTLYSLLYDAIWTYL